MRNCSASCAPRKLLSIRSDAAVILKTQVDLRLPDGRVQARSSAGIFIIADAVAVAVALGDGVAAAESRPKHGRAHLTDATADARHRGAAQDHAALQVTRFRCDLAQMLIEREFLARRDDDAVQLARAQRDIRAPILPRAPIIRRRLRHQFVMPSSAALMPAG